MKDGLFAVILALAVLAGGCATTGPDKSGRAVIQAVSGRAEISADGSRWKTARSGARLAPGTIVRTAPGARVDLRLGTNAGVLTVHPDSTVELERLGASHLDAETAAVLNLARGRVMGDTLDLPPGMKIVVKTLGGVHEIR
jgi:hypothetical protein